MFSIEAIHTSAREIIIDINELNRMIKGKIREKVFAVRGKHSFNIKEMLKGEKAARAKGLTVKVIMACMKGIAIAAGIVFGLVIFVKIVVPLLLVMLLFACFVCPFDEDDSLLDWYLLRRLMK